MSSWGQYETSHCTKVDYPARARSMQVCWHTYWHEFWMSHKQRQQWVSQQWSLVSIRQVTMYTAWHWEYIDGLVQDCSNSSALAMELLQSCTKPSICNQLYHYELAHGAATSFKAQHIPLPDSLGQVKLPVWQVDLIKSMLSLVKAQQFSVSRSIKIVGGCVSKLIHQK